MIGLELQELGQLVGTGAQVIQYPQRLGMMVQRKPSHWLLASVSDNGKINIEAF